MERAREMAKRGIGLEIGPLDGAAEPLVDLVAGGRDVDVAVLRLEDAGGNARRVIVARLGRDLAAHQPARGLEVEHREHCLEQRGVHPLPLSGDLSLEEGDEDALGQQDARAQVGNGNAHSHGALTGNAGDGHQSAHPLGDLIDPGPIAVGPALPEAGNAAVDQARVDGTQALVVDAETPLDVRPVVLHHDIGRLRQLLEDRHPFRLSQVQGHGALVAMQVLEVEAVAVAAHAIPRPSAGHLDLDGPSAPIHQLPNAGRAGPSAGKIEHREAPQRKRTTVVRHAGQSPSVDKWEPQGS